MSGSNLSHMNAFERERMLFLCDPLKLGLTSYAATQQCNFLSHGA